MRTVQTNPINYGGHLVYFRLHFGQDDLVKSWDIICNKIIINKADPETRASLGFTDADLDMLNTYANNLVLAQEGVILGNETYA